MEEISADEIPAIVSKTQRYSSENPFLCSPDTVSKTQSCFPIPVHSWSVRRFVAGAFAGRLSILILIKLIKIAAVPLAKLGIWVEFFLNLLSQNGGLLKTLFRKLTGDCIHYMLGFR